MFFMQRHFTTSVYVYNPEWRKFLLIKHKKFNKWMQPGGHIEENELPDDAAIREVWEETGLQVELVGERLPRKTDQIKPYAIQHNVVVDGEHEHLDLVYLAVPIGEIELRQNYQETEGIAWFRVKEIEADGFNTFPELKVWVRYFYELMNGE